MSLELPYSIKVLSTESLDEKYLNGLVPYTSIAQVNSLLPVGIRSIGLTVNIANQEYWYKDNTTDGGLVVKIDINNADLLHTTGNETKNGTLIVNDTGDGYGVQGNSIDGTGVYGTSENSAGVNGASANGIGVLGYSANGKGVIGNSANGIGVEGTSLTNLAGRFETFSGTKIVSFLTNSVEQAYILATGLFKANKILVNTTTDNGIDALQVNGTISATAASTANQVVIKSQLDAVRPYKVYTALLNQSGTSSPTATVLENTTGLTITWNRSGAFQYNTNEGFSSNPNKIAVFFNYANNGALKVFGSNTYSTGGDYKVGIFLDSAGALEGMVNSTIEIRVYN